MHWPTNDHWNEFFRSQQDLTYFKQLNQKLDELYSQTTVYPPEENLFSLFDYLNPDDIKVIIIGQDPYHGPGQADGIAFSSQAVKTPASLRNIYKELETDIGIRRTDNSLVGWVKQGVFLMNTIWSVTEHEPASHRDIGWHEFSINLLTYLLTKNPDIIVCLWGNFAKTIYNKLSIKCTYILTAGHPSPLSWRYFADSRPFSKINQRLIVLNKQPINWE